VSVFLTHRHILQDSYK